VLPVFGFGESNKLYLTAGVGGYGIRTGIKGEGKSDFGLNGGLGLWLPFINGFVEARYHHFIALFQQEACGVRTRSRSGCCSR
jgi:hypothetical protein